jgi:hypothetical protein
MVLDYSKVDSLRQASPKDREQPPQGANMTASLSRASTGALKTTDLRTECDLASLVEEVVEGQSATS